MPRYIHLFESLWLLLSIESGFSVCPLTNLTNISYPPQIVTVGYQCLKSIILIENNVTEGSVNIGKARARLFMRQLIPFVVTTIVVRAAQECSSTAGSKDDKVGMQVIEEGIQTLKSLAAASSDGARKFTKQMFYSDKNYATTMVLNCFLSSFLS